MFRTLVGVSLVAVLAVSSALLTAANHAKNDDEAGAWQAVTQAIQQYQEEQSDENLEAIEAAAASYRENFPDGEHYNDAVSVWLQVQEIQENWDSIVEYLGENLDNFEGQARLQFLGMFGVAHANLGNEDEANEVLEEFADVEGQDARIASHYTRNIRGALLYREPGTTSPNFTLPKVDGDERVSLEDLEGNYVLLDFWATWCRGCIQVANEHLKPLWERYQNENFEMVSIGSSSRDTAERQRQVGEENGWEWMKLFDVDGDAMDEYAVTALPFLVLIDPEGKVVGGAAGAELLDTVQETLAEAFGEDAGADE